MGEFEKSDNNLSNRQSGSALRGRLRVFLNASESGVFIAMSLFFIVMAIISPAFRTPYNITVILKQIAVASILGMGQTLVIISGAFDLSQGSIAGLGSMIAAIAWQRWGFHLPCQNISIPGIFIPRPPCERSS